MASSWKYQLGVEISVGSLTDITSTALRLAFDQALADTFAPLQVGQFLADLYSTGSLSPLKSGLTAGRRVNLKVISDPAYRNQDSIVPNGFVVASWNNGYLPLSGQNWSLMFSCRVDSPNAMNFQELVASIPTDANGNQVYFQQAGGSITSPNSPVFLAARNFSTMSFAIHQNSFFGFEHTFGLVEVKSAAGIAPHNKMFWNGTQVRSQAPSVVGTVASGTQFAIGGAPHLSPGQYNGFTGRIWDVRLWARALGNDEFLYHYQLPDALDTDGRSLLVAQFKFAEGSGSNVRDYSTVANTAVFVTTSTNQTPASWAAINPNYPLGIGQALFSGRTVDLSYDPKAESRILHLEASSDIERMQNVTLTTSLFANYLASSLATEILTRSGVSSFSVEALADTAPYVWYQNRAAFEALDELLASGDYRAYVDGAGTVRVQNRYWAVFSGSVASYSTQNGSAGMLDMRVRVNRDRVINEAKFTGERRRVSTNVGTIAFLSAPIMIPASGGLGFWLSYIDPDEPTIPAPAIGVVTPVKSADWYLATNSDGSGTELTTTASLQFAAFGATAVCTVFNGTGNPAWLTKFQIRGQPAQRLPSIAGFADNSSSQAVYGRRSHDVSNAILGDAAFLGDIATLLVLSRKEPAPQLQLALHNVFPDVHKRQVGDGVSVVDSVSGVNSSYFVRRVSHDISLENGLSHRVTYDLEYFQQQQWLVLDHPVFGVLNSRRLGV